jgi:hypothetical protein
MSEKFFIISGTGYEARIWVENNSHKYPDMQHQDFVFVSGVDTLRGVSNPSGIFTGSFRQRQDIEEIIKHIYISKDSVPSGYIDFRKSILG